MVLPDGAAIKMSVRYFELQYFLTTFLSVILVYCCAVEMRCKGSFENRVEVLLVSMFPLELCAISSLYMATRRLKIKKLHHWPVFS